MKLSELKDKVKKSKEGILKGERVDSIEHKEGYDIVDSKGKEKHAKFNEEITEATLKDKIKATLMAGILGGATAFAMTGKPQQIVTIHGKKHDVVAQNPHWGKPTGKGKGDEDAEDYVTFNQHESPSISALRPKAMKMTDYKTDK